MPTDTSAPGPLLGSPGGRRARSRAATRRRILAATLARLRAEGYEAMTTAQVARDAGVAAGTVFQYASTKAELLMMATADRWSGAVQRALTDVDPTDPVEAIRRVLEPLVETARREPANSAAIAREILFGAPGEHHDDVVALVRQLEDAVAELVAGGGAEPDGDARAAAELIIGGGLLELHRVRVRGGDDADLDARLRRKIALLAGPRG